MASVVWDQLTGRSLHIARYATVQCSINNGLLLEPLLGLATIEPARLAEPAGHLPGREAGISLFNLYPRRNLHVGLPQALMYHLDHALYLAVSPCASVFFCLRRRGLC